MGRTFLLVGLGGFLGSVCRFAISLLITKNFTSSFPYATLIVNVVGCLIIGLAWGLSEKHEWLNQNLALFISVGFCGGFTTYSTFAKENINLLKDRQYLIFALYSSISYILCLGSAIAGRLLSKFNG